MKLSTAVEAATTMAAAGTISRKNTLARPPYGEYQNE